MEYATIYVLRETGTITQGGNAGMVLDNHIQEIHCGGLVAAQNLAKQHRSLEPAMKIEICTRQYVHHRLKAKRHFKYTFVELYP